MYLEASGQLARHPTALTTPASDRTRASPSISPPTRGAVRHLERLVPGASPHARGAVPGLRRRGARGGTIPRMREEQLSLFAWDFSRWGQSRMRGEQRTTHPEAPATCGPSLHARGAGHVRRDAGPVRGTIPADAGASGRCASPGSWRREHPRARGAGGEYPVVQLGLGTIPACAESSVAISAAMLR